MKVNNVYNILCLEGMKKLNNKSIDCIITSPPYWQLRDYGFTDQWGLEPTYEEYLQHLWQFMDEAYRVLKDDGTCWINLGDTYSSTSKGSGGCGEKTYKKNRQLSDKREININITDKCLLLIPHRFAIGCIDRGWILRNDIIWAKKNAMPESVTDRFSKKHEFIFFFVKNKKYYFDLDSIRDNYTDSSKKRIEYSKNNNRIYGINAKNKYSEYGAKTGRKEMQRNFDIEKGKNPGDVSEFWDITTKGTNENHYAAYNSELIRKPILAGCKEKGVVLDPFAGTGTTLLTAYKLNRQFIGFEGSKEYYNILKKKVDDIKTNLFEDLQ